MKPTLAAALLGLAFFASPAPAAACGFFCDNSLADDAYPPAAIPLPIPLQEQVAARHGKGLSLAGFYNDPSRGAGAARRPLRAPLASRRGRGHRALLRRRAPI